MSNFDADFMRTIALIVANIKAAMGDKTEYAQAMCVAEEGGEFLKATRRHLGLSRKDPTGAFDEMTEELADVIISAMCAAHVFGIDIEDAIDMKIAKIESRGGF
jgi:NTP pyrophosphatase (non-canonical NTP hydrolase)